MRSSILTLVLISLPALACPSSDDGSTGETGGSTSTAGTDTTNATSSTTINPTTSITATSGTDSGGTTDGGSTTSGVDGSSSESGGFNCPNEMPTDEQYGECSYTMAGTAFCSGGGVCLTIDGGMGGQDYNTCWRGCASVCNCWVPPAQADGEYSAELLCDNIDFPGSNCEKIGAGCNCFLECGDGKTCPPNMECVSLQGGSSLCAAPVEPMAGTSSSGSDSGSGSGSGSDSGSDSGTGSTG